MYELSDRPICQSIEYRFPLLGMYGQTRSTITRADSILYPIPYRISTTLQYQCPVLVSVSSSSGGININISIHLFLVLSIIPFR